MCCDLGAYTPSLSLKFSFSQATSNKLKPQALIFFLFSPVGPAHKLFSATICILTFFLGGSRPQALLCDNLSRDKIIFCFFSTVRHIVTCDNSLLDVTFEQHCCHTATGCANQRTHRQHALFYGSWFAILYYPIHNLTKEKYERRYKNDIGRLLFW
jgi:hypothetical protein